MSTQTKTKIKSGLSLCALSTTLIMGMALTGCESSPSANDAAPDGTYMTALIDGKPWRAEIGTSFFVRPAGDTGTDGSGPGGLIGTGLDNKALSFQIRTDQPDSLPLDSLGGKHVGEFTKDGNFFFTRSGYVKFTRVSESQAEGTFACEMVATANSADPHKVIQVANGRFLAKAIVVPRAKYPAP